MSSTPLLEGKVAVITGASRGIGAATARAFSAAGASVALAARDEAALGALADELSTDGSAAIAVPTDVGDAVAVERLVAETVRAFGHLELAFNNAAGGARVRKPRHSRERGRAGAHSHGEPRTRRTRNAAPRW